MAEMPVRSRLPAPFKKSRIRIAAVPLPSKQMASVRFRHAGPCVYSSIVERQVVALNTTERNRLDTPMPL